MSPDPGIIAGVVSNGEGAPVAAARVAFVVSPTALLDLVVADCIRTTTCTLTPSVPAMHCSPHTQFKRADDVAMYTSQVAEKVRSNLGAVPACAHNASRHRRTDQLTRMDGYWAFHRAHPWCPGTRQTALLERGAP
jgi:hypothetical protein